MKIKQTSNTILIIGPITLAVIIFVAALVLPFDFTTKEKGRLSIESSSGIKTGSSYSTKPSLKTNNQAYSSNNKLNPKGFFNQIKTARKHTAAEPTNSLNNYRSPEAMQRKKMISELWDKPDKNKAIKSLESILVSSQETGDMKLSAIKSLAKIKKGDALHVLIRFIQNDQNPMLQRVEAIRQMGLSKRADAANQLMDLIRNEQNSLPIRRAAINALANIGGEDCIRYLEELATRGLNDELGHLSKNLLVKKSRENSKHQRRY